MLHSYKRRDRRMGQSFANSMRKCDIFGFRVNLLVEGEDKQETLMGVILSILILVISLYYAGMKYETMMKYGDTVINEKQLENYYRGD